MSIYIYIIQIILGVAFLFLGMRCKSGKKTIILLRNNSKKTTGTIKFIEPQVGSLVWFIVEFEVDGKTITAKTEPYSFTSKKLQCGDTVNIAYYYNDLGQAEASILDEGMYSGLDHGDTIGNALEIIGGTICFAVIVEMLMKL